MVPTVLMNFVPEATPQTEMLRNCFEDRLSTDHEYVIQLLEASSVNRDGIVGNHRGDLGQQR